MTIQRPLLSCLLGVGQIFAFVGCSGGEAPKANPTADKSQVSSPNDKKEKEPAKGDTPATSGENPSGQAKSRKIRIGAPTKPIETITADALPDYPSLEKVPVVKLSVGHQKSCLVTVGQPLSDAQLPDLDGKPFALSKLRSEKLTLVLFWSGDRAFGVEAFSDLAPNFVKPYFDHGLQVISIHVGQPSDATKAVAKSNAAFFPVLLDPQGEYFAKVAQSKLPRVYLLDGEGKILWFDVEYSRSCRRELHQTIRLKLGLNPPPRKNI